MEAYIYQAAMLCEKCCEKIRTKLTAKGKAPADPENERTYDSDEFPKGPYSDGGGEADSPQHCDECRLFLENPLTSYGYEYVKELARDWTSRKPHRLSSPTINEWLVFYEIPMEWSLKEQRYLDAEES